MQYYCKSSYYQQKFCVLCFLTFKKVYIGTSLTFPLALPGAILCVCFAVLKQIYPRGLF